MNSPSFRVRRATLDDIGALTALWRSMQFPADELARRITEFQVAETAAGEFLGSLGLQIAERQGLIHSEGFVDFALADQLRPLLWERLQNLAANQGLLRLWTLEQAPFWTRNGLAKAEADVLEKLPRGWRGLGSHWLTIKLRDALEDVVSVDKEFAVFMQAEKQRTARALQHARLLKGLATVLAFAILLLVIAGVFLVARHQPRLR